MIFRKEGFRCRVSGVRSFGLRVTSCEFDRQVIRTTISVVCFLTPETWNHSLYYELAEFLSFVRRETFRAAVRLWITPFFPALSNADWTVLIFADISSPDISPADDRTSLTIVLILVLTDLLRKRLNSFCRARFIADLWFANGGYSFPEIILNRISINKIKTCQENCTAFQK